MGRHEFISKYFMGPKRLAETLMGLKLGTFDGIFSEVLETLRWECWMGYNGNEMGHKMRKL